MILSKDGKHKLSYFFAWIKSLILQFMKFGIVGVSNTLISLAVYYFLFSIGIHYVVANTFAFIISTFNAYFWNIKYVFKLKNNTVKDHINRGTKTFFSYGISFIINTVLLFLWIDILSLSGVIAPILNIVITVPLNFVLNKLWVFKK